MAARGERTSRSEEGATSCEFVLAGATEQRSTIFINTIRASILSQFRVFKAFSANIRYSG